LYEPGIERDSADYGWEKTLFLQKEFKGIDEMGIKELKGPSLDSFQYQSDMPDRIFKMFDKTLYSDKKYLDRI